MDESRGMLDRSHDLDQSCDYNEVAGDGCPQLNILSCESISASEFEAQGLDDLEEAITLKALSEVQSELNGNTLSSATTSDIANIKDLTSNRENELGEKADYDNFEAPTKSKPLIVDGYEIYIDEDDEDHEEKNCKDDCDHASGTNPNKDCTTASVNMSAGKVCTTSDSQTGGNVAGIPKRPPVAAAQKVSVVQQTQPRTVSIGAPPGVGASVHPAVLNVMGISGTCNTIARPGQTLLLVNQGDGQMRLVLPSTGMPQTSNVVQGTKTVTQVIPAVPAINTVQQNTSGPTSLLTAVSSPQPMIPVPVQALSAAQPGGQTVINASSLVPQKSLLPTVGNAPLVISGNNSAVNSPGVNNVLTSLKPQSFTLAPGNQMRIQGVTMMANNAARSGGLNIVPGNTVQIQGNSLLAGNTMQTVGRTDRMTLTPVNTVQMQGLTVAGGSTNSVLKQAVSASTLPTTNVTGTSQAPVRLSFAIKQENSGNAVAPAQNSLLRQPGVVSNFVPAVGQTGTQYVLTNKTFETPLAKGGVVLNYNKQSGQGFIVGTPGNQNCLTPKVTIGLTPLKPKVASDDNASMRHILNDSPGRDSKGVVKKGRKRHRSEEDQALVYPDIAVNVRGRSRYSRDCKKQVNYAEKDSDEDLEVDSDDEDGKAKSKKNKKLTDSKESNKEQLPSEKPTESLASNQVSKKGTSKTKAADGKQNGDEGILLNISLPIVPVIPVVHTGKGTVKALMPNTVQEMPGELVLTVKVCKGDPLKIVKDIHSQFTQLCQKLGRSPSVQEVQQSLSSVEGVSLISTAMKATSQGETKNNKVLCMIGNPCQTTTPATSDVKNSTPPKTKAKHKSPAPVEEPANLNESDNENLSVAKGHLKVFLKSRSERTSLSASEQGEDHTTESESQSEDERVLKKHRPSILQKKQSK